jgi:hypothetical protein
MTVFVERTPAGQVPRLHGTIQVGIEKTFVASRRCLKVVLLVATSSPCSRMAISQCVQQGLLLVIDMEQDAINFSDKVIHINNQMIHCFGFWTSNLNHVYRCATRPSTKAWSLKAFSMHPPTSTLPFNRKRCWPHLLRGSPALSSRQTLLS